LAKSANFTKKSQKKLCELLKRDVKAKQSLPKQLENKIPNKFHQFFLRHEIAKEDRKKIQRITVSGNVGFSFSSKYLMIVCM